MSLSRCWTWVVWGFDTPLSLGPRCSGRPWSCVDEGGYSLSTFVLFFREKGLSLGLFDDTSPLFDIDENSFSSNMENTGVGENSFGFFKDENGIFLLW